MVSLKNQPKINFLNYCSLVSRPGTADSTPRQTAFMCTNARYHSNLQALELMRDAELQELFRDAPFHELLLEPGPTILDACRRAEDILRGPKGYCMVSEGTVWINHSKTDQPRKDPSSQNKRSHSSSNEVTPCPSLEYTPRKASPRTQT
ncbi:tyrosine--tRNA ligase, mitochondrial-like isoform X3 [Oncorhynchus keta]|uniref:tyrosine--tRNA ligase, mitochondrial-like isoform X3 n=1 Tax=Oncorhynchus keta TaxID=8018 RepID=UPI0015FD43BB|nr:tyrosine--tRNA ligase, mitochondrial-like isoform X3 [Oncorhynchus keta]